MFFCCTQTRTSALSFRVQKMVDSTHIAFAVVTIAIISCVAIFHAQLVDLKNKLGAAHAHIDILAQHVTDLRQHQNRQAQPHARRHAPVAGRRLDSDDNEDFDLGSYVRRLKSFKHPAGVNLNNNNSFMLFGKPVDMFCPAQMTILWLLGSSSSYKDNSRHPDQFCCHITRPRSCRQPEKRAMQGTQAQM